MFNNSTNNQGEESKIDWQKIYDYLKGEKYCGTYITGHQYIKHLKEINEYNRILFWEYHMHSVSNLPKYDDIYSVYFTDIEKDRITEYKKKYKDWDMDILDTLKRHNFSTDFDYQNYVDGYIHGKAKSILTKYKFKRNYIFKFLLDSEINCIKLTNMNQEQLNEYMGRIINTISDRVIERYINSIGDFLLFHQDCMTNQIYLEIEDLESKVPSWDNFPYTIDEANEKNIQFYNYWISNYKDNNIIEVNGVLSYLFLYLYEIIADFIKTKDISKLNSEFEKMDKYYGHYDAVKEYLYSWWKDAYLWVGDKRNYLEYKMRHYYIFDKTQNNSINFNKIISEVNESVDIDLIEEAFFLVMKNKKSFTEFGLTNLEDIIEVAKMYLADSKLENGMNIKDYFYNKFDFWNLSKEDYEELKEYIVGNDFKVYKDRLYKTKLERYKILKDTHIKNSRDKNEEIKNLNNIIKNPEKYSYFTSNNFDDKKSYEDYLSNQVNYAKEKLLDMEYGKDYLFRGIPRRYQNKECYILYKKIPQIISEAFEGKEGIILREIENILREERNIPRIGEGWISETILYRQMIEAFPDEKIIHHGRPSWLGKQHLDIYFPRKNIGIEYQGLQHSEPVEYFGGIEAFEKQQKMDNKKKRLCEKNNCKLIYVYPDYNFEEIKNKVETLLLSIIQKDL